ncbi:MAG: bile acid:sodium symporter family protein, partial [Acidimicrobiia bacterium]
AMGLSLTIPQIIGPLKDVKLVLLALAVNFIAVPAVVWGIQAVMDLDQDVYTGLVLMATAAGAPFLPKLAQAAKGNVAFSVGLMVMLMVATVVYMPIVMPLILDGVEVNAWDIASSLIFLMLLPLAIGLFVKARYSGMADGLQPFMSQTSSVAIMLLLAGGIILQWDSIVSLIGTGGIFAILLFLLISLALGYFAGGSGPGMRSVMGLGTAQRNLSAALVVGGQNFSDSPDVLVTVMVAGIVGLIVLLPIAGEFGRRSATGDSSSAQAEAA